MDIGIDMDLIGHGWEQLAGRFDGPLFLRLFLQPLVAIVLAVRAGRRDAHAHRAPYFWTMLAEPGDRRRLVREGWRDTRNVFLMAVVIDGAYQVIVYHWIYLFQALLIAVLLAIVPYVLVRGPVTRATRRLETMRRRSTIRHLWLVPSLYAAGALTAAALLPRYESRVVPELAAAMSVPAAMAVYSAIASGMIALTGIVFSLVFVMVQLSATAYSPRLVLWVARNPLISHALGIFTATFLYALTALAWVDRHGTDTVPLLSASLVMVLLLVSTGVFIGLVERVALLSVTRMVTFAGNEGRAAIDRVYPDALQGNETATVGGGGTSIAQAVCHAGSSGVLQRVDATVLVALARDCGGTFEVARSIGDTIGDATPLVFVAGARAAVDERALRRAFVIGNERTFDHDPAYAIRLLVDIGVRGLWSPLDPTTAVQALDQIGDLLLRLGRRRLDVGACRDDDGTIRVVMPVPRWEDFLRLGFEELQSYGAESVQVMRRMKAVVADLLAATPPARHAALREWQARIDRRIARTFTDAEDQADASAEDRQGLGVPRRRAAA